METMADENTVFETNINSKLPPELLCLVFQFLSFSELKEVLLVCRYK